MASIVYDSVSKRFPDGTEAVRQLDLEIRDGEFMVLVGPSGCGKTTALRMCAGLELVTSGELRIDGEVVNDLAPQQRDVAMVFQNYALYPHMSVFDNIAFPLESRRVEKAEIDRRVRKAAAMLGLEEHLKRKPRLLSGGQRQRVAMGRAVVREPQAFLMDEPLSNLDAKLRVQMRADISRMQRELKTTTVYVTHDQTEAMTMGDRIAVLRKGVLQQVGPPQELYDNPTNLFVASFVGSPAMNLFRATIETDGNGGLVAAVGEHRLALSGPVLQGRPALHSYAGREVCLGVRPEDLQDAAVADGSLPRLPGNVTLVETLGAQRLIHLEISAPPVITDEVLEVASDVDQSLAHELEHAGRTTAAVAVFDAGATARVGDRGLVSIRPERLQFFDLERGGAIR